MIKSDSIDPGLSVIIPCFNEVSNVEPLMQNINKLRDITDVHCEIIFVDGGSVDGTVEALNNSIKKLGLQSRVRVCEAVLNTKSGYGADIMRGLRLAKGQIVGWTHADLQTDILDVVRAYRLILNSGNIKNTIVKGRRKQRPFWDAFFTFGMQIFVFFMLKTKLDDINAQPKIFHRDVLANILCEDTPADFSLDLFLLWRARSKRMSIIDFPVFFTKRLHGHAKGGGGGLRQKIGLTKRTLRYIIKLKLKTA